MKLPDWLGWAALPLILAGLRARGLTPVTLPKLLEDGGYLGASVIGGSGAFVSGERRL
ncbi:MAG TPA: hypothetical protein VGS80_03065 [Ktedonobacterales bacterium]|nr:hypothetical protein [Ktedonobacterales bacterium]